MKPDQDCVSGKMASIRSSYRNKHPHTAPTYPGERTFIDIQPSPSSMDLNPLTDFPM
jgi:hypothetical protein